MKKIGLCSATEKGFYSLKQVVNAGKKEMLGWVCSFKESNVEKSWDADIADLCREEGIPYHSWKEIREADPKKEEISAIVAIGWRYLLPKNRYQDLENGLIVFHDSLLPKYRGFAPTATAMICGEKEAGVSALHGDKEMDTGDLIYQVPVPIGEHDYASDVIAKEMVVYGDLLLKILAGIEEGELPAIKQDESKATYSIWRGPEDCRIDWNEDAEKIELLVRAVSRPYPGAYCFLGEEKVIIDEAETLPDLAFAIRYPGKIWKIENGCPTIVCGTGLLKIIRAHNESGKEISFERLRSRLA